MEAEAAEAEWWEASLSFGLSVLHAIAAMVAASGPLREFEKSTVKRAPMMVTSTEFCIRIRFSRGSLQQQRAGYEKS